MTLALTGKTPRRRTVLVLAAFFAIIGATLGGLWAVNTAFAHHDDYTASATCEGWQASATYTGGSQERLLVIRNVSINGDSFAADWATDSGGTPFGGGSVVPYTLSDSDFADNPPGNGTKFMWQGIDDAFSIFNRSGAIVSFKNAGSAWGGEILLYQPSGDKWSRVDVDSISKPSAPSDCTGKIQVHKYLPKDTPGGENVPWQNVGNSDDRWTFKVYDDAALTEPPVATFSQLGAPGTDIPLTEVWVTEASASGFTFAGFYVPDGDGDSGNDKCNQQPADGPFAKPLHITPVMWATKGNHTGTLHLCAYNDPAETPKGHIEVHKVVTNVTNDTTVFDGDYGSGTSFTFSEAGSPGMWGSNEVATGPYTVTEHPETGYVTKGWALWTGNPSAPCPETWSSTTGDNTAEITVEGGSTRVLCFYNEKVQPGHIEVHKVVTNVTDDTTVFDGDYGSQTSFTFSEAGSPGYWGSNQVAAGPYTVTEHPETGYVTKGWALWTMDPKSPCPSTWTSTTGDNTAEITVEGGSTRVLCFYNERQDREITITKEVVDNGIAPSNEGGLFKYDIRVNGTKVGEASLTDYEGGGTASTTVSLASLGVTDPLNANVTIAEWGMRPTGWVDDAMFPQNDIVGWGTMNGTANLGTDHNAVTFRNKRGTRDITVCKLVADNGDSTDDSGTFHFDVRYGGTTTPYPVQSAFTLPGEEGVGVCNTHVTIPSGVNVEIVEWMGAIGRPAGWNGDTPGYPKYDFDDSGNSTVGETALVSPNVSKVTFANRTNTRTGSVIIHKVVEIGSSTNPDDSNPGFTGTFVSKPWGPLHDGDQIVVIEVPAGHDYTITEDAGTAGQRGDTLWNLVGYFAPNSAGACPTTGGGTTLDSNHITVVGGETTTVCVLNHRNQPNELTASVNVIKVVTGSVATTDTFDIALTTDAVGGANGTASLTNGTGHLFPIGLDTDHHDATFSVTETPRAGYTLLGYKLLVGGQGCPEPGGTYLPSISGQAIGSASSLAYTVCVYNEPLVNINVHKTEQNGLITNDGVGWKVTLSGCGMTPETQTTDALGNAKFENKPLCATYLVSEDLTSKAPLTYFVASGYQSSYPVNATTAGQTYPVLFANVLWSPPPFCIVNCEPPKTPETPVITPTPETPTATATQPVVIITPTATPTEAEAVEGEKTPGQQATPIAPVTGSGSGGSGGMNIVLAGLGLAAVSLGLGTIALGRRRTR